MLRHSSTVRSLAWTSSSKCAISAGRFATNRYQKVCDSLEKEDEGTMANLPE